MNREDLRSENILVTFLAFLVLLPLTPIALVGYLTKTRFPKLPWILLICGLGSIAVAEHAHSAMVTLAWQHESTESQPATEFRIYDFGSLAEDNYGTASPAYLLSVPGDDTLGINEYLTDIEVTSPGLHVFRCTAINEAGESEASNPAFLYLSNDGVAWIVPPRRPAQLTILSIE